MKAVAFTLSLINYCAIIYSVSAQFDGIRNQSLLNQNDFAPGIPFRFPFQKNSISRIINNNIFTEGEENPLGKSNTIDDSPGNCLEKYGLICRDCHSIMLCNNEVNPQITWKCPITHPYCNNNICSSEPPKGDEARSDCLLSHFRCTSVGYFPDPTNCSQFFYCHAKEDNPMIYRCPPNYVYTPEGHRCKRRIFPMDCAVVDCDKALDNIAVYRHNRAYFGFCSRFAAGNHEITMYKCPDDRNFQYDSMRKGCAFKCTTEGVIPDRMDCRAFYVCYRKNFLRIEWIHQKCPEGYYFKDSDCIVGSCNAELSQ